MSRAKIQYPKIAANTRIANSLKYTRSGEIEVGLKLAPMPGSQKHNLTSACLAVRDTGIGMSADFLKYRAFTPFAQENGLSPGTGLGLSIVKLLVSHLQGIIDVKSQIGVGTTVKIFIPLDFTTARDWNVETAPEALPSSRPLLRGRSLCYVGPQAYQSLVDPHLKITPEAQERSRILARSLLHIVPEYLAMDLIICSEDALPKADVYFFDLHDLEISVGRAIEPRTLDCLLSITPLVALCGRPTSVALSKSEKLRGRTFPLCYGVNPSTLR